MDEKTEAQRGCVTCPKSHSWWNEDLKPMYSGSRVHTINHNTMLLLLSPLLPLRKLRARVNTGTERLSPEPQLGYKVPKLDTEQAMSSSTPAPLRYPGAGPAKKQGHSHPYKVTRPPSLSPGEQLQAKDRGGLHQQTTAQMPASPTARLPASLSNLPFLGKPSLAGLRPTWLHRACPPPRAEYPVLQLLSFGSEPASPSLKSLKLVEAFRKDPGAPWASHSPQWASVASSVNWADEEELTEKTSACQLGFQLHWAQHLTSFLLKTVILVQRVGFFFPLMFYSFIH